VRCCGVKLNKAFGKNKRTLIDNGKVEIAVRLGRIWVIPKNSPEPIDGRMRVAKIKEQAW